MPARTAGAFDIRAPASVVDRAFVLPLQTLIHTEGVSGRLLVLAAAAGLVVANVPGSSLYQDFWSTPIVFDAGWLTYDEHLRAVVNDGLMTLFFLLVTLEVKHDLVRGHLSSRATAVLPVAAAVGGMLLPAAIYLAITAGSGQEQGWGVPIATDVAISVGVLWLLGRSVSPALAALLLAMAVVDDIIAIGVIALVYSEDVDLIRLAIAGALLVAVLGLRFARLHSPVPFVVLGVAAWFAMAESGVHPTIAGVALGALHPSQPSRSPAVFHEDALAEFEGLADMNDEKEEEAQAALGRIEQLARTTESPMKRTTRLLQPWVGYLVLPLFAFANAGIELSPGVVESAVTDRAAIAVAVALAVGKPVGVMLGAMAVVGLGLARLPGPVRWLELAGAGCLAGIGFSVAIFVANLAFSDPAALDEVKLGIFAASIVAGLAGLLLVAMSRRMAERAAAEG